MKEKKNSPISLDPLEWLDGLAIWAMRYCINRSTYANDTWKDILSIIEKNSETFRGNKNLLQRLKFFAGDIRSEISMSFGWNDGISIEGNSNSIIKTDAYSLITKFLEENPEYSWDCYNFKIDCVKDIVTPHKRKENRSKSSGTFCMYGDFPNDSFSGWIKLANSIDKRNIITVSNGEIEESEICAEIPTIIDRKTNEVAMVWSPLSKPNLGYYLPEYIKTITFIGSNEK